MLNLEKLKKIRESKGMTQTELAKKIGITPSHLSNVEKGGRGLSTETLSALVQVLEINIDDIWDSSDDTSPPQIHFRKGGIIVEKTRYILPPTQESYRIVADQIGNRPEVNKLSEICTLIELFSKADEMTKAEVFDMLRRGANIKYCNANQ
jgi:transcriptional regulator with XRE-family HTH domain